MNNFQSSVKMDDIYLVDFKTSPNIIPAAAIQKHNAFPLHTGGMADIFKCYMSTQSEVRYTVAIKSIRIPSSYDSTLIRKVGQRIRREAYVWMQLSHDNILALEGVTEGFGPLPALVTLWMDNGSLGDYLKQKVDLSRDKKLSMLTEVAAGLEYLHCKGIVHANLTPYNVLVSSDGRLHIGGFGLSVILAELDCPTFESCQPGSIRWTAPEMLDVLEDGATKPTKAADVYSYGCIMMLLCSGHAPYHSLISDFRVLAAVLRGQEPFREITGLEEDLKQLAQKCLSNSSECRPSASDIAELFRSKSNISKTMMELLSKLRVNQIPKAALSTCDSSDRCSISGTLKYNWLHGSDATVVAVKTLDVGDLNGINIDKTCDMIRREVNVRERLKHETILDLYGMTTGFGVLPSFVYPWMAHGSLHDYLKREFSTLSPLQKFDILYQVADVIKYLHKNNIAHGSLTGDNVLLDDAGRIRIADFSRSVILDGAGDWKSSEQLPGAVRYVSPESVVRDEQTGPPQPTKSQDVYSYGCITILVLSGKVPYWWISEESEVLSAKVQGTEPFLPTVEIDEVHLDLFSVSGESSSSVYAAVELIARGGFANVHKCSLGLTTVDASVRRTISHYGLLSTTTSVDVAVKDIRTTDHAADMKAVNRLFREIRLWLKLKHENVVPLWGVTDGAGSVPALVSPWLENGALTGFLQRKHETLSSSEKIALLRDVARGLQYLHSKSIVHGDLSGNNVLVDASGKALLTDFGLSVLLSERSTQASLPTKPGGSARWMAPESLGIGDEGHGSPVFSTTSDIYSFGGIMLQAGVSDHRY
ncbi:kinase-like domain-containing protein [Suillus subalutaceus]|uniref:kinase-like domain-containing protein n=1 Tax=Suillus subalutaceus TaxID=48586 RepID=UPI001B86EB59|nr:kinase-like domain-containing protein [Suillus subalutaceus]KAG1870696.1 kinase-like domain-containing protein [Suillus subalutaceus]